MEIQSKIRHLQQVHQLERELLHLSGLRTNQEIKVQDVQIDYLGTNHIHTIETGASNSEVLALLPGYGGTGALYYQMMGGLSESANLFCLDMLGMGLSSRPKFECKTTDETIDFFVESLEKWRQTMKIEKFSIGGHSFGGYIACHYAMKYSDKVNKLLMLSPVGVTNVETSITPEQMRQSMHWLGRPLFDQYMRFWNEKKSLTGIIQANPIIGAYLLKTFVTRRFRLPTEHSTAMLKYLKGVFQLPESGELAIHNLLKPIKLRATLPLENLMVKNLARPTTIYYGDHDWMDPEGAVRIVQNGLNKNVKLKVIKRAGHQVILENPKELVKEMKIDLMH